MYTIMPAVALLHSPVDAYTRPVHLLCLLLIHYTLMYDHVHTTNVVHACCETNPCPSTTMYTPVRHICLIYHFSTPPCDSVHTSYSMYVCCRTTTRPCTTMHPLHTSYMLAVGVLHSPVGPSTLPVRHLCLLYSSRSHHYVHVHTPYVMHTFSMITPLPCTSICTPLTQCMLGVALLHSLVQPYAQPVGTVFSL